MMNEFLSVGVGAFDDPYKNIICVLRGRPLVAPTGLCGVYFFYCGRPRVRRNVINALKAGEMARK